jgi:hypothetical protein
MTAAIRGSEKPTSRMMAKNETMPHDSRIDSRYPCSQGDAESSLSMKFTFIAI